MDETKLVAPADGAAPGDLPKVWFRLRQSAVSHTDQELVLLVRQLGAFYDELDAVSSVDTAGTWPVLVAKVHGAVNFQDSPEQQGAMAARAFREATSLGSGCRGIGDLVRGALRARGVLVVESPAPAASISGCTFHVGVSRRPCIFVNTHSTSWFGRNRVVLHEFAHVVFDLQSAEVTLDRYEASSAEDQMAERRAEAFAREAAAPAEALKAAADRIGVKWSAALSSRELGSLVADLQVEKSLLVSAAVAADLIDEGEADVLRRLSIRKVLPELTPHALSTKAFVERQGASALEWVDKRDTEIPSRSLRLPVDYVKRVVEACRSNTISIGRAAALLMIGEETYAERFL